MPSLSQILTAKIGKHGKSKAYIASQLGVSEKTIENYMNGKREPKQQALTKLATLLDFNLNDLFEQNVPRETAEAAQISTIGENVTVYRTEKRGEISALDRLIESNFMLAQANLKLANAHDIIAKSTERLTQLADKSVVDDEWREKRLVYEAMIPGLQELLIDLGMGKHWKTRQEGQAAVHNKLYARLRKQKEAGTHDGSGK